MIQTPVRFGVIADVQYAEKPDAEGRSYRNAIKSLDKAVAFFNTYELDFAIQLGDLINGGEEAFNELQKTIAVFNQLKSPGYHVLGNHEFFGLARADVMRFLQVPQCYYCFNRDGWLFVVLDTLDYSIQGGWPEDSSHFQIGAKMLDDLMNRSAANAQFYNGAVGERQLHWLDSVLSDADTKQMQVIVFTHLPLMPFGEKHTVWNAEQVIAIFEKHPSVKACISGHNHFGGYDLRNGIHYVILEAAVNAAANDGAWGIIELVSDKIQINGVGALTSRMLNLR